MFSKSQYDKANVVSLLASFYLPKCYENARLDTREEGTAVANSSLSVTFVGARLRCQIHKILGPSDCPDSISQVTRLLRVGVISFCTHRPFADEAQWTTRPPHLGRVYTGGIRDTLSSHGTE